MIKRKKPLQLTGIDGLSKTAAKNRVNKILAENSKGIFSDQSWAAVHKVFAALEAAGINYATASTEYGHDSSGTPNSKTWKFEVYFTDNRSKDIVLHGSLVACGAGSVADPLDRYDIAVYVS